MALSLVPLPAEDVATFRDICRSTDARYLVDPKSTRNMAIAAPIARAPGAAVYVLIQKSGRHGLDNELKALGNIFRVNRLRGWHNMYECSRNDNSAAKELYEDENNIGDLQNWKSFGEDREEGT